VPRLCSAVARVLPALMARWTQQVSQNAPPAKAKWCARHNDRQQGVVQ
jgi:hypothetical protein